MLQYFRLQAEIQSTKSIVSFLTFDGFRVDISKKFIKKDQLVKDGIFLKTFHNLKLVNT